MAQTKVSELAALTTTDGAEELLVNDGGTSKKVTIANLLHDNSIDSDHYVDGSIDNAHLAANSVDSDNYVDASIDNAHLADDAVGVAELSASGTANSSTFLRGDNAWAAVTVGDNSVDSDAYVDGSIDTAHLAADVITGAKIADNAID